MPDYEKDLLQQIENDIIFAHSAFDGVEISERVLALWLPRQDLQTWTRPKAPSS
jgi:hypothetical protein